MMILLILTILISLFIYAYIRWIRLKKFWSNLGVPHVPPHPLVGSLTFLQKENPAHWLRHIYHHFKYPYVGIWIFWRPGLVINSTEIARNILIKDQANFRNRLISSGTTDPVGRLNLFTLDSVLTDFSTDIIGSSAFGVVSNATLTGKSHLRNITDNFMKFSFIRGLAWCCVFFMPQFVDFFRFNMFPKESTDYMRKILREIIAQRGGFENKIKEPRDLLDILIKIKQEECEELEMTENMMLAQASLFLQGGFDTTSTVLSFIFYELAFNPEVQAKLNIELQEAKDKFGDDLFEASVLSQLTYLNCIINEGLRKYPILGWLDRVALADYKIDDNLTIKAGTPLMVNVMGMHYDPEFYPEPDMFNPDRFLGENKISVFLPFGEGPRKCIGQRFGLSVVRHGLAAVTLNYELKYLPNAPKPTDVKLKKKGLSTSPEEILSIKFIPRKYI